MRHRFVITVVLLLTLVGIRAPFAADVSGSLLYDGEPLSETFSDVVSATLTAASFSGGGVIEGTVDLDEGRFHVGDLEAGRTYQLEFHLDRPTRTNSTYEAGDLSGFVAVDVENADDTIEADADLLYYCHVISPIDSYDTLDGSGLDCTDFPAVPYPITVTVEPVPRATAYTFRARLSDCPSMDVYGYLTADSDEPSGVIEWGTSGEDFQSLQIVCTGNGGQDLCTLPPFRYSDAGVWAFYLRNGEAPYRPGHHSNAVVIPAVASAPGAAGTFWSSSVSLINLRSYERTFDVTYTPRGNDGAVSFMTTRVTVPARSQLSWADVLDELFSTEGAGALEILGTDLAVTSRTSTPDGHGGSYGQGIPPLQPHEILSIASTPSAMMGGVQEGADFRTNLGLCEVWGESAGVTITVFDASMTELGSDRFDLRPFENLQVNRVAFEIGGTRDLANGLIEVTVVDGNGRIGAYISVVDNSSGDPTYITVAPQSTIGN